MNRKLFALALSFLLIIPILQFTLLAQDRSKSRIVALDRAEDEEDLNRELWEFARKSSYDEALGYVASAQTQAQAVRSAEVALPTGWKLTPAGTQVEVGRLPFEAVPFAGRLVVLDTGYYTKEPQEVSIVDVDSGRVVKTLKIQSLFPSAEVGLDGDLYISGGFDQKVYRIDHSFNIAREYAVAGYAGGLAWVAAKHIGVAYLLANNSQGDYIEGKLALLNTDTGKVEQETRVGYFPYAVRFIAGKFYLTMLGENRLLVMDAQFKSLKSIAVGERPHTMCTDGQRLYVVNTNSDDLSVVDIKRDAVISTISVRNEGSRFGVSPSSCAVDGNRL